MRRILVFALLLLSAVSPANTQHLPIKTFTSADGLANDQINKMLRDSRGFLWFCTNEGLSRFDGYSFVNFGMNEGLPAPDVDDILETRKGEFWIATGRGLVKFNPLGKAEAQSPNAMFVPVLPEDGIPRSRSTNVLLEDRSGVLWVGTLNGLFRMENVNGRRSLRAVEIGLPNDYPEQRFISDLLEDRNGSLWIAAPSGLYCRRPDGRVQHFTTHDGLPMDYLHCLLEDRDGHLWGGTREHGFFRFAGNPFSVEMRSADPGGPKWISQQFQGSDQRFWSATSTGLVEYLGGDPSGANLRTYTTENGLSHRDLTTLMEDLAGNLWIGTAGAGVARLARDGFITFGEREGVASADAFLQDAEGGVCIRGYRSAGADGPAKHMFARLDGDSIRWFLPDALKNFDLGWVIEDVTLQSRSGEWWVGTGEGVFRFPPAKNFSDLSHERPLSVFAKQAGLGTQIYRLFEDSRRRIWIVTVSSVANGLYLWEPGMDMPKNLANSPGLPSLKGNLPRSFAEDRSGNVWIGLGPGAARFRDGKFQLYSNKDGLPEGGIQQIYADHSGRLWFASGSNGLARLDHPEAQHLSFARYNTAQGLSSNLISTLIEDEYGRMYVGTGRGLDRLDPASSHVKHFNTGDGLPSVSFRSAFRDRAGNLWFGTGGGLSRLRPAHGKSPVPKILITGLRVSGFPVPVSAFGESNFSLPPLKPAENQVQIDFAGLSFEPGETLRYQYKLEGTGEDWSVLTDTRTVKFAYLAPGAYRFEVRAENSDGVISPAPAALAFEILSPFWRRGWFLASAFLATVLLGYALHRYRVRKTLELERVRTRIAADLHDDIGSNLTQIAILSEVANSQLREEHTEAGDLLSSIAQISRESVSSMSDIVWAINPKRDSLLDLARRMKRFANEVLTPRGIEFRFEVPEGDQEVKLGADVRRDIFLVFKEVLNNAVRHSGCTTMSIALRLDRSWIELTVTDDGCGFDPAAPRDGQGLENIKRRAFGLGGSLQLQSGVRSGTAIVLRVPLRARAAPPIQTR